MRRCRKGCVLMNVKIQCLFRSKLSGRAVFEKKALLNRFYRLFDVLILRKSENDVLKMLISFNRNLRKT